MRFLLIPAVDNAYDLRMMVRLGQALIAEGHHAAMLPADKRDKLLLDAAIPFDVVIEVNKPRPQKLARNAIHIAWVQDLKPTEAQTYGRFERGDDVIYSLGDAGWMGLGYRGPCLRGSLLTAVHPELLDLPVPKPEYDFNICAYVPYPLPDWSEPQWALQRRCQAAMEQVYRPLAGDLCPNDNYAMLVKVFETWLAEAMKSKPHDAPYPVAGVKKARAEFDVFAAALACEYPRLFDRIALARMALAVSDKCRFHGWNWELFREFARYHVPYSIDEDELIASYRSAKINLHNNFSGLGLHTRVLETMAAGCFVMAHSVAEPQKAGRLATSFEPGRHFGEFTPGTFGDVARHWLDDEPARNRAISESREIVREKHLWTHRAQQILADLDLRKPVYRWGEALKVVSF